MILLLGEHHIIDGRAISLAGAVFAGHGKPEYFISGSFVRDIPQLRLCKCKSAAVCILLRSNVDACRVKLPSSLVGAFPESDFYSVSPRRRDHLGSFV
jgi:hypothetical protein